MLVIFAIFYMVVLFFLKMGVCCYEGICATGKKYFIVLLGWLLVDGVNNHLLSLLKREGTPMCNV